MRGPGLVKGFIELEAHDSIVQWSSQISMELFSRQNISQLKYFGALESRFVTNIWFIGIFEQNVSLLWSLARSWQAAAKKAANYEKFFLKKRKKFLGEKKSTDQK